MSRPPGPHWTKRRRPAPNDPASRASRGGVGVSRRVHTVSPSQPGCHRQISHALATAESGAIIDVLPGEYDEALYLGVPVTITARDGRGSVVVTPPAGSSVFMGTETATLSGLVVRHRDGESAAIDISTG